MQDLNITLIQTPLQWEDATANRERIGQQLARIQRGSTDMVVLPEMFSTGFSMKPEQLAETMDGPTVKWMGEQAAALSAVVTGSLIIKDGNKYYNRLIWMRPDGSCGQYDKRHLFSYAGEDKHYTAGKERLVVELKGWRVCPLVCYDLRFPVWSRNRKDYDLLLYVANWPERRSYMWKQLLIARAIENQAYVVGLNRVGDDGNGISHSGDSAIIDPLGEVQVSQAHQPATITRDISAAHLLEVREKFRFLDDADGFEVV
ncbi:amidohydrolase [soil metagenome]